MRYFVSAFLLCAVLYVVDMDLHTADNPGVCENAQDFILQAADGSQTLEYYYELSNPPMTYTQWLQLVSQYNPQANFSQSNLIPSYFVYPYWENNC